MKTKSKRFVNLAALCLALLGTTLLMGEPVKAEVISKRDYMTRFGLDNLEDGSAKYPPNLEARYKGYLEGYKKGLKGDDIPERPAIQVPDGVQSSYGDDYRDGYEEGFGEGQHKRDPLETEAEEDSQRSEERQEGREEGRETPEDSQRSEERQEGREEESDNQQGDMLTPIVDAIVDAIVGAWGYVLSWFKL
ncbi:hypothetical protein [Streptococcus pyogenes]|uniref:hypothetical protein n=1 Tax=Streptococcus pyogenes TaxID=1314 RepID=UPI0010A14F14|nr:hypothetical protein [Streptococcus pyogenes]VGU39921.1 hypothetical membrane associated protein [Streptococcus pyogenes]